MPEKEDPYMLNALRDYMDIVCTIRFLGKYTAQWEEELLLRTDTADKETGYFALEVMKTLQSTLTEAVQKAQTEAEFNTLMAENFKDTTQE